MTAFGKIKRVLSTSEGRLKAFIGVCGSLILILIFAVGALELTSTPTFCKSCHEMSPEYFTWESSAHNQVACVDCHIKPGAANFVKHKVASFEQIYLHFRGSYVTPIEIKESISNVVCERCHDMSKRVTTPSGDIKFPHNTHLGEQVSCVQCHAGVVHGNIEEKGFTALVDYSLWNSAMGRQYVNSSVSSYFTKLPMKGCITCHKERDVPITCDTCHKKIVKPESHLAATWQTSHGVEASKDLAACDKCHSITSKYLGDLPINETLADYARTNTLCSKCHAKKPPGHTQSWKKDHAVQTGDSRSLCLVCHNESRRKSDGKTAIACEVCHFQKHPDLSRHTFPIPASGYGAACNRCHPKSSCETCHISSGGDNSPQPKEE